VAHGNPVVVFAGQGGDAQPGAGPKRFLNGNANCGRAFFDSIGPSRTFDIALPGPEYRVPILEPCARFTVGQLGGCRYCGACGTRARATAALDAAFCPVIPAVFNHVRRAVRPGRTAPPPERGQIAGCVRFERNARDARAARAFAPYLGCRAKYATVQSLTGAECGRPESA
jgi:hypothetical protein